MFEFLILQLPPLSTHLVSMVLGIKSRASHMLGKVSINRATTAGPQHRFLKRVTGDINRNVLLSGVLKDTR